MIKVTIEDSGKKKKIKEVRTVLIYYFISMNFEGKRSSIQNFEQEVNIIYLSST